MPQQSYCPQTIQHHSSSGSSYHAIGPRTVATAICLSRGTLDRRAPAARKQCSIALSLSPLAYDRKRRRQVVLGLPFEYMTRRIRQLNELFGASYLPRLMVPTPTNPGDLAGVADPDYGQRVIIPSRPMSHSGGVASQNPFEKCLLQQPSRKKSREAGDISCATGGTPFQLWTK